MGDLLAEHAVCATLDGRRFTADLPMTGPHSRSKPDRQTGEAHFAYGLASPIPGHDTGEIT
jgi:hypothetical protein